MEDWLETLRRRYRINADAEVGIGRGWRGIVERFYASAEAILVDPGRMRTRQIKQKLGHLDIHVRVSDQHRTLINWHIKWAEDEASHNCEHCGSPYADLTPARHIIECEDCRYLDLALDQRTRRASEIKSAACRYVRDCARAGKARRSVAVQRQVGQALLLLVGVDHHLLRRCDRRRAGQGQRNAQQGPTFSPPAHCAGRSAPGRSRIPAPAFP